MAGLPDLSEILASFIEELEPYLAELQTMADQLADEPGGVEAASRATQTLRMIRSAATMLELGELVEGSEIAERGIALANERGRTLPASAGSTLRQLVAAVADLARGYVGRRTELPAILDRMRAQRAALELAEPQPAASLSELDALFATLDASAAPSGLADRTLSDQRLDVSPLAQPADGQLEPQLAAPSQVEGELEALADDLLEVEPERLATTPGLADSRPAEAAFSPSVEDSPVEQAPVSEGQAEVAGMEVDAALEFMPAAPEIEVAALEGEPAAEVGPAAEVELAAAEVEPVAEIEPAPAVEPPAAVPPTAAVEPALPAEAPAPEPLAAVPDEPYVAAAPPFDLPSAWQPGPAGADEAELDEARAHADVEPEEPAVVAPPEEPTLLLEREAEEEPTVAVEAAGAAPDEWSWSAEPEPAAVSEWQAPSSEAPGPPETADAGPILADDAVQLPEGVGPVLEDEAASAIDAEILEVFRLESVEVLADLTAQLNRLAARSDDLPAVAKARALAHRLKGAANTVGLTGVGAVCRGLERLLDAWESLLQSLLGSPQRERRSGESVPDLLAEALACAARSVAEANRLLMSPAERHQEELIEEQNSLANRLAEAVITLEIPGLDVPAAETTLEEGASAVAEAGEPPAAPPLSEEETPTLELIVDERTVELVARESAAAEPEAAETGVELAAPEPVAVQPSAEPAVAMPSAEPAAEAPPVDRTGEQPAAEPARHEEEAEEDWSLAAFALEESAGLPEPELPPEFFEPPLLADLAHLAEPGVRGADVAPSEEPAEDASLGDLDELLAIFQPEAEEHLGTFQAALLRLEATPGEREPLAEARRVIHTLKGAAAMVGFERVSRVCHELEDLLETMLADQRPFDRAELALLFSIGESLDQLIRGGPDADLEAVEAEAHSRIAGALAARQGPGLQPVGGAEPAPLASVAPAGLEAAPAGTVRVALAQLDELLDGVGELVINRASLEQRLERLGHLEQEMAISVRRLRQVAQRLEDRYEVAELLRGVGIDTPVSPLAGEFDDLELDRYTELHRFSRELTELAADVSAGGTELAALRAELNEVADRQTRLVGALQERLLAARLVPFNSLAPRLERALRGAALQEGKEVELRIEGGETTADKLLLEELADPLLHLVRNAVAHGIEEPGERRKLGKPARGLVVVRATREANTVVVEVRDDGRGVDEQRVIARATERGHLPAGAAPTGQAALELIFLAGVSTRDAADSLAGRGVGLDVVASHVRRLKGWIGVTSTPGKGATFTLRLPARLAMTRALHARSGGQELAIPVDAVRRVLRVQPAELAMIGDQSILQVDGENLPAVFLDEALGLGRGTREREHVPALVLSTRSAALLVDELAGQREIVVKPLLPPLRAVRGLAGATVTGGGAVLLVLNPNELVAGSAVVQPEVPAPSAAPDSVLVVDDSLSIRRVVGRTLERAGWQVLLARDGLEALDLLRTVRPAAIVLDIEMPRMDGFELLAVLRGQEELRSVPVAMLTSRAGDKHRRKAFELGASAYLVKPYREEELLQVVADLVGVAPARKVA